MKDGMVFAEGTKRVVNTSVKRHKDGPEVSCRWTLDFTGLSEDNVLDLLTASNSLVVRLQAEARKSATDGELRSKWSEREVMVKEYLPGRRPLGGSKKMTPQEALAALSPAQRRELLAAWAAEMDATDDDTDGEDDAD